MSEPIQPPNPDLVKSIEEAEQILPLDRIKINFQTASGEQHSDWPLFNQRQIVTKGHFWNLFNTDVGSLSKKKLSDINSFLDQEKIQEGIKEVHEHITEGMEQSMTRRLFTNLMILPLFERLHSVPTDQYNKELDIWRNDWNTGIDPEKFRFVFSRFFKVLGQASRKSQEEFIAVLGDKPIDESEADFLGGIFENVYGEIHDEEKLKEADLRNRGFVERIGQGALGLRSQDLYHTTDLSTLPKIIDRGLLATECTSLTQDGFGESTFAVSFHNFVNPPNSLETLGQEFNSGQDTIRNLPRRAHLVLIDPTNRVDQEFILYPPESFWFNRARRKNITAGRYIGGFDSDGSEFGNKSIAYVLIGVPSPAISFVMLDEQLGAEYSTIARNFPFYLPAYSYEGKLLYTPEQHDTKQ